ncbi:MAG: enoyl-CoA hydratase/isomerase family protein [Phycisphaerales bacterium]
MPVELDQSPPLAEIVLADATRRNAIDLAMFDALDLAIACIARRDDIAAVILRGDGKAFCAGFDLEAVVAEPSLMRTFIERLGSVNRSIRRLPMPVVAAVHGAALAGGCALLSACDFVVVAPDATLGYPVHRIGVSPSVTTPLLAAAIGPGAARALLLSGDLIDGATAQRLGLATHVARSSATTVEEARSLGRDLAAKAPLALRATKRWLNELDGSLRDDVFDGAVRASTQLVGGREARSMLDAFWSARRA